MTGNKAAMRFIPTGPHHAALLAALHKTGFDHPWDEASFASSLSIPGTFGFLACDAGETEGDMVPLGFILNRAAVGEAEILTITVNPDHRGQGLASGLLQASFAIAEIHRVGQFFLEVADDNTAAMALYQKSGFVESGRRKNYYKRADGSFADAIVMQKMLQPAGAA